LNDLILSFLLNRKYSLLIQPHAFEHPLINKFHPLYFAGGVIHSEPMITFFIEIKIEWYFVFLELCAEYKGVLQLDSAVIFRMHEVGRGCFFRYLKFIGI